jgi:hypothetical protein
MISSTVQYLIASTLYLFSFLLIYKIFLSRLTHFTWMRIYLLGSLGLALILPMITLPVSIFGSLPESESYGAFFKMTLPNAEAGSFSQNSGTNNTETSRINFLALLAYGLILIYASGVFYKLVQLTKKLLHIRNSIIKNPKEKRDRLWIIYLETQSTAYSFFNYIFISKELNRLKGDEFEKICMHESIHVKQYHTLDILFVELVSILFWFNPLIYYFKIHLQEVHEYLADACIITNTDMKKSYSRLLLTLTSKAYPPILSSAFSAKQINRRISMIGKTRSLPRSRFAFILLMPAAAFLLISFSSVENRYKTDPNSKEKQALVSSSIQEMKVGVITWENNMLYTDSQLTGRLGIKTGDAYSKVYLEERLFVDEDAVNSLYLDHGYLFFQAEFEEIANDDETMNLTITLYEGEQFYIRQITIVGNGSVPKEDVLKEILFEEGDLFSKTKLINSVGAIAQMGLFDPEGIAVNPTPIQDEESSEFNKVDIEFRLNEQ